MIMIFIRRANLVPCCLLFLSILWRREARRVQKTVLEVTDAHSRGEYFFTIFSTLASSNPNLFSITGLNKSGDYGIAFDRLDRLSRLRAFPYDRFDPLNII